MNGDTRRLLFALVVAALVLAVLLWKWESRQQELSPVIGEPLYATPPIHTERRFDP